MALKSAHNALLIPPEHLQLKPEKLAKWRPRVRDHIDWDAVLRARDLETDHSYDAETTPEDTFSLGGDSDEEKEFPPDAVNGPLTVGLIGVSQSLLPARLFRGCFSQASQM